MIDYREEKYHGEKLLCFDFEGHEAKLAVPSTVADKAPWLWRAEFFGAFDTVDQMLLSHGWHIAYIKLSDMFGHPSAVEKMKQFHDFLVDKFKLCSKSVLCGMSRGGLYSVNYTAKHPEDVAGLYLDAPVLNVFSWPLGLGNCASSYSEYDAKLFYEIYSLDKDNAHSFTDNAIDKASALAENNIPICFICGGADVVVPFDENAQLLIDYYSSHNKPYKLFYKPDCGHHPHSLDDPTLAVKYIEDTMLF